MGLLNRIGILIFIGTILFFTVLMFNITLPYFSFNYDIDFLLTKQNVLHLSIWRYAFYTHISASLFVLLFGAFQFIKTTNLKTITVHRLLGKIYVVLVLFICAPSGLIMAFYANGGWGAKSSFIITSILWWCFTCVAFLKIKNKKIDEHQSFMYRSYALTLSAITLRLYALCLPLFIKLSAKEIYTTIAWSSWIPNLIVVELIIWSLKKKRVN